MLFTPSTPPQDNGESQHLANSEAETRASGNAPVLSSPDENKVPSILPISLEGVELGLMKLGLAILLSPSSKPG